MPLPDAAIALLGGAAADLLLELRRDARKAKVRIDDSELRTAVLAHIRLTERWSSAITLLHSPSEKRLDAHFVSLNLAPGLERFGESGKRVTTLDEIYESPVNVAILGGPGAGKTTSLQRLMQRAIAERENGSGGVPILVRLRDLREDGLVVHLLAELSVSVSVPADQSDIAQRKWRLRIVVRLLEQLSAIVMVDGLDEVDPGLRLTVTEELRDLALASEEYRLIVTCRTAEYHVVLPSIEPYTLRKLGRAQITEFATKWLGDGHASGFVAALTRTPYAGTEVVPLLLAHLCVLYQRDEELPRRHVEVYEQIVALLVDKWDQQRGVRRKSRHASLNWRGKERLLAALCFELTMRGRRGSFSDFDLRSAYGEVAAGFELAIDDAGEVIDELESHTGLLLHTGFSTYDFLHLSIQEYLTAMHARGLPHPLSRLIPTCPNELAITIACSGDAATYLEEVLETLLRLSVGPEFTRSLLGRLGEEAPTFVPSARFGWVLLAFQHLLQGTKPYQANGLLLTTLLPQPTVQSSLELAVVQCEAPTAWYEADLIPSIRAEMPPFLMQAIKDRRLRAIRAPSGMASKVDTKKRR
jgi:hypothetical protein